MQTPYHERAPGLVATVAPRTPRSTPGRPTAPTALLFWILVWISLLASHVCAQNPAPNTQNVTIPLDSDQIVYTPFLCDASESVEHPEACAGAWFLTNVSNVPEPVVVSQGLSNATDRILPQMFLRFRASTLYLTFAPGFNASVNITVSTANVALTNTVQSTLGFATIVNIPQDTITTLTLTVLPSQNPIQFGIESIVITVPTNADTTSILPSLTLPPPSPISTWFSPTTTSFATTTITLPAEPSKKTIVPLAVGITVGVGLGLTSVLAVGFFFWRRRKMRLKWVSAQARPGPNDTDSENPWHAPPPFQAAAEMQEHRNGHGLP